MYIYKHIQSAPGRPAAMGDTTICLWLVGSRVRLPTHLSLHGFTSFVRCLPGLKRRDDIPLGVFFEGFLSL